jgi:DNA replication and repair protein RecF
MTAPPVGALAWSPEASAGAAPAPLAVRQLRLVDFRNYRGLRLDFEASSVVLVGPNGAGKTNLLEALSFLVPGRGLRRARLEEICRRGRGAESDAATWAVAATLDTPNGRVAIGTGIEAAATPVGARRAVRIDGRAAASQTALGLHVAAVWLTPQLDRLFLDGPREPCGSAVGCWPRAIATPTG